MTPFPPAPAPTPAPTPASFPSPTPVPVDRTSLAIDRRHLPNAMLAALAASTALSVGLATQTLPNTSGSPLTGFLGGTVAGALAVVTLRSVSVRSTSGWMCIVGALMILRFGGLPTGSVGASAVTIGWVFATTATMVLGARTVRWRHPTTPTSAPGSGAGTSNGTGGSNVFGGVGRAVLVVGCLASAAAIGLGPAAADAFSTGARDGSGTDVGDGSRGAMLQASPALDMTRRPRLTDAVVMTVSTDRPGFWRSQTFDQWDGTTWTRTDESLLQVPETGTIDADRHDLGARGTDEVRQEFRIEASQATSLPVLPSARVVNSTMPLLQWLDGSVLAPTPLGHGATYTVVSRRPELTEELLRRVDTQEIPREILDTYASPPVASPRVERLAETITDGAGTNVDKVLAIEAWLGENTEYSLDAPLSPDGSDVVDHFLFTSKLGWCEQISSSLTVLLRLAGVPARVAIGYVPGDRDPISGRYLVRERDAHAWTEVWFPEVGWVAFDPTANVSLSGEVPGPSGVAAFFATYGALILLGVGIVAGFGTMLLDAVRRFRARHSDRRATGRTGPGRRRGPRAGASWPDEVDIRLDRLGSSWGRAREVSETTTAYAAALAGRIGDERLPAVGAAVDRTRYGGVEPSDAERTGVLAVLDTVPDRPAPP